MTKKNRTSDVLTTLAGRLTKIREQERRWRTSHSRSSLNNFLRSVYNLHRALRANDVIFEGVGHIARLTETNAVPKQHPIRTIIDAVSNADRRTKSRWTRALRYAWLERKKYNDLKECLEANGGIIGCANEWAAMRAAKRTPRGYVRLGGEDRVPKIPYFISIDQLDKDGFYDGQKLR